MSKFLQIEWNPDARTLRDFGWIALVGFGLLAVLAWYEWLIFSFGLGGTRVYLSAAFAALGVIAALTSLIHPPANRALFVGLSVVAYPIGFVISHVLMAALFFGMFAPLALVFRALGRDSMNRSLDPGATSYWTPARPARDSARYFKQF